MNECEKCGNPIDEDENLCEKCKNPDHHNFYGPKHHRSKVISDETISRQQRAKRESEYNGRM